MEGEKAGFEFPLRWKRRGQERRSVRWAWPREVGGGGGEKVGVIGDQLQWAKLGGCDAKGEIS